MFWRGLYCRFEVGTQPREPVIDLLTLTQLHTARWPELSFSFFLFLSELTSFDFYLLFLFTSELTSFDSTLKCFLFQSGRPRQALEQKSWWFEKSHLLCKGIYNFCDKNIFNFKNIFKWTLPSIPWGLKIFSIQASGAVKKFLPSAVTGGKSFFFSHYLQTVENLKYAIIRNDWKHK